MRKTLAILGTTLIIVLTIFLSGCLESEHDVEIKVDYSGSWSGAYGTTGSIKSVAGSGSKTFHLKNPDIVSANFQKNDDSHRTLRVDIVDNGKVVASESTSAPFGIASVTKDLTYGGYGGGTLLIIWFIIWLFAAFLVYRDAKSRGANKILWFLIVLILGVIGIIVYYLIVVSKHKISPEKLKPPIHKPREEMLREGKVYCTACGFGNREGSKFCKRCGARLD